MRLARSATAGCLSVFLLVSSPSSVPAANSDDERLQQLMAEMRASNGVSAKFVEEKHIALLSDPLTSSGTIYVAPPHALLRVTTAPSDTRLLVSSDDVRYRDDAGADRFDLSSNSAARQFVENFLVLFTGDLAGLRDRYDVEARFDTEGWHLRLEPRRSPFNRLVDRVVLEGRGRLLSSIEMVEKDGDSTLTRIVEMDPDRRFTAEELTAMFAE